MRAYAKGSVVTILRTVESSVHFDLESISYSISPESVGTALLMYQDKNYAETFLEEKGLIKGDSDEIWWKIKKSRWQVWENDSSK